MTEPATAVPPHISLSVGDRVVYPNQGLCTVTAIKAEEIAGQKLVFVSLQVVETGANIKAPQEKLTRIGIRRLSNADEVKRVFDFLKSDSEKASLDWKKRARDNTLRLSEGGLRGLAEVVKGLQVLSELRPLPPKERELYNDARHLVVTEIAAAVGGAECDAEDSLDIVLFPVGRERPKRSIEEFKELGDDDALGLGDDLLGLGGDEEEPQEAEEVDEASDGDEGDGEAPAKRAAAKPVKEKPAKKKKAEPVADDESDDEGSAETKSEAPAAPKKRGRPPKPKTEVVEVVAAAEPKKRGRPPKLKLTLEPEPAAKAKRGRPPKAK